jgi:PleD family two-component response regulator
VSATLDDCIRAAFDRIRVSLCQLVVPGTDHAVSVSIGIAMSDPTTPPEQLIRRADTQMYRDKRRWPATRA